MWDGRLVSRNLISINHELPCVVQFTNGEKRTLSKYSKIEHTICNCADLDKEEIFKLANGRDVSALCSTNVFLQADSCGRAI